MLIESNMFSFWQQLEMAFNNFGINTYWLFIGVFVISLITLLAFREFLYWYLKIYHLQEDIQNLRSELNTLNLKLDNRLENKLDKSKKKDLIDVKTSADVVKSKTTPISDDFSSVRFDPANFDSPLPQSRRTTGTTEKPTVDRFSFN